MQTLLRGSPDPDQRGLSSMEPPFPTAKIRAEGTQFFRGGRAIYYFQGREQAKNQTQTRPT